MKGSLSKSKKKTHGKTKRNKQKQTNKKDVPNYSGHHIKGSYQKSKKKNMGKQKETNKDVQTSLAQGPPEPD